MNDLVEAARQYLSAGLSVISLTGKAPNSLFHPEGLNTPLRGIPETPEDDKLIERLFTHPTTSGIGIPIPPHVVVVDIDGEEGAQLFEELIDEFPDTPVATTGRGMHLWYFSPHEHHSIRLGEKLDVKGLGGYVAAPPSRHPNGGTYKWLDPLVDEDSGQRVVLDWLPDGIEKRLGELAAASASQNDYSPGWDMELGAGKWRVVRAKPDLEGLKRAIIEAPDGNQNNVIAWAAMTARDEGVPLVTAIEELLSAAIEGGHPRQRAQTAITGAYKRAKRPNS